MTNTNNKPFQIGNHVMDNRVVLAPMAGICNSAFRLTVKEFGAGLVYAEMISDKGIVTSSVKWFTGDLVENAHRLLRLHCLFDRVRSVAQLLHELIRSFLLAQHFSNLLDRSENAFQVVWISDKCGDVLVLKLLREYFELRRRRDQHNLGLQRDDSFKTRM